MIKRIGLIALYSGLGQLFLIFSLKFFSYHSTPYYITRIGQVDSLFQLILTIIALGLQSSAIRNIAIAKDWQDEYGKTQSARFMLSLLMLSLVLLGFVKPQIVLFALAPLVALSGDYALYSTGHPVMGSFLALVRILIPYIFLIAGVFLKQAWSDFFFVTGIIIAYISTNIFISKYLGTKIFYTPKWINLKLYLQSLPLGVVTLALYFIGPGIILIMPFFYSPKTVAIVFLGLKLYTIFKGILRIIHQAFVREMIRDEICLKVDNFGTLFGLSLVSFVYIFPNSFISTFFGTNYLNEKPFFYMLSCSALVYSLFSSSTTKALFERKDIAYAQRSLVSSLITISFCIILAYANSTSISAGISLIAGELIFAVLMLDLLKKNIDLKDRLLFLFKNLYLIFIPFSVRLVGGDSFFCFFISLLLVSATITLVYFRKDFFY
ncbi:MAG TPA: hypothetical protein VFN30_06735 [Chitinophagaceae bacterium]|nr:hypothetical protein [Chitinophagaceae bacterium]